MKRLWKNHKLLVIGIPFVLAVAAALGILGFNFSRGARVKSSIEEANRYLSELDYEQAIASYRQALDLDGGNYEANMGLAEAYDANDMSVYAENVYREMLEKDGAQADVYEKLANLYIRDDRLDEARDLLDEAVGRVQDEDIEELHDEARPEPPASSYDEGAYKDRIRVELIPSGEGQAIYYTLDGSDPTEESPAYDKPIIMRNGKTQVKAMAVNSAGFQSEVVSWDYDVQIADAEVEIKEPVIEQLLREELEIPYDEPIYNDDVEQVTELYIIGAGASSLSDSHNVYLKEDSYTIDGYEYEYDADGYGYVETLDDLGRMPFLEKVVVAYQPNLDISALSRCKNIRELSLVCDGLNSKKISVIGALAGLERLNLGWNKIQDISGLGGLSNLKSLGIWGNNIRDVSPVSGLSNLEYLDFADNMVEDISPVGGLSRLEQLWMYHNQVSDVGTVSELPALQVLMLRDNPVSNLEALRDIYPRLTRIDEDILNLGDES